MEEGWVDKLNGRPRGWRGAVIGGVGLVARELGRRVWIVGRLLLLGIGRLVVLCVLVLLVSIGIRRRILLMYGLGMGLLVKGLRMLQLRVLLLLLALAIVQRACGHVVSICHSICRPKRAPSPYSHKFRSDNGCIHEDCRQRVCTATTTSDFISLAAERCRSLRRGRAFRPFPSRLRFVAATKSPKGLWLKCCGASKVNASSRFV